MSRLPLAERADFGPEDQGIFDLLAERPGPVNDVYLLLALAPNVAQAMMAVSRELRGSKYLPHSLRELAILYTAQLNGCQYEFDHHWNFALDIGVARAKLENLSAFEESSVYDATEKAVLRLAKELAVPPLRASQRTWSELVAALPRRAIVELLIVIGWYHLGARLIGAVQLKTESWYQKA